ncbi:MAG: hypothetical protein MZV63_46225 [Marinilabiliales bacterium]|nr:hypothetical protein [Marinilabiliales bacterium]
MITTGNLADIAASMAKNAGVKPPAVIVIGEVVNLYDPAIADLIPFEGFS